VVWVSRTENLAAAADVADADPDAAATATATDHAAACTPIRTPEEKRAFVHSVFETISDDYDKMNDIESFRMHRTWKRRLVEQVIESLSSVASLAPDTSPTILDVASGTGDIAIALAAALPNAHVVGLDFSENMLAVARRRSESLSPEISRAEFIWGDALALPFADNSIDALTISFGLRNLPDYEAALREFSRVLRPGACFFCLEASYPTSPVIKPFFRLYFRHIMPLMASLVVGHRQQYQCRQYQSVLKTRLSVVRRLF